MKFLWIGNTDDELTNGKIYETTKDSDGCYFITYDKYPNGIGWVYMPKNLDQNIHKNWVQLNEDNSPKVLKENQITAYHHAHEAHFKSMQPAQESEAAAQPLGEWAGAQAVIGSVREWIAQADEKIKKLKGEFEEENTEQKHTLDAAVDKLQTQHNIRHNHRERALSVRINTIHEDRNELADWLNKVEKQMGEKE